MNPIQLNEALKGQQFTLPDMKPAVYRWPTKVSPHREWLRGQVDSRLRWIMYERFPPKKAAKTLAACRSADFGLFGACWWPQAERQTLRIQTFFAMWLFLWDDEIDTTSSNLSMNLANAEAFRQETLEFVQWTLGLQSTEPARNSNNILISSFESLAADFKNECSLSSRQYLYDEIVIYVRATRVEQCRRVNLITPTIEEYMECRMGTSALGCIIAMFELCENIQLSPELCRNQDLNALFLSANIHVSVVNDIVSLRKEIIDGPSDNLVTLHYLSTGDLAHSVQQAVEILDKARRDFDEAADRLLHQASRNPKDCRQLKNLIEGCQHICTGNLSWSLQTGRYLGAQVGQEVIELR